MWQASLVWSRYEIDNPIIPFADPVIRTLYPMTKRYSSKQAIGNRKGAQMKVEDTSKIFGITMQMVARNCPTVVKIPGLNGWRFIFLQGKY